MKKKIVIPLLAAEAVLLFTLTLLVSRYPNAFSSLFAFPFEQLGAGLRMLSESGWAGNGIAIALWAGLSLSPLLLLEKHSRQNGRAWENASLCIFSAVLLAGLYVMANPGTLPALFPKLPNASLPTEKAVVGCTIWSVAVCCGALRIARRFRESQTVPLLRAMRALLYTLCAVFTGALAIGCGGELLVGLQSAQDGLDRVWIVVRFLAAALPYLLDSVIALAAVPVLDRLLTENRPEAEASADRLARLCCLSLWLTTAATALFNVCQLLCARWLNNLATNLELPLTSLLFALAALLLSRLIGENRRLHEDNELFI